MNCTAKFKPFYKDKEETIWTCHLDETHIYAHHDKETGGRWKEGVGSPLGHLPFGTIHNCIDNGCTPGHHHNVTDQESELRTDVLF